MKITKRQLKQIIREEYSQINGNPRRNNSRNLQEGVQMSAEMEELFNEILNELERAFPDIDPGQMGNTIWTAMQAEWDKNAKYQNISDIDPRMGRTPREGGARY